MSNTDYKKANEFMAEKCQIEFIRGMWRDGDICRSGWTITDPRCREIIRERFEINTIRASYDKGIAREYWYSDTAQYGLIEGQGKTIAEAEIACILAIVEA